MSGLNNELKLVKAAELFALAKEILNQGRTAWITVTGMSMYPLLTEGRDSVELAATSFDSIKKGDIVLIKRMNGVFVLHRVLKKEKDCFYMVGDAQQWVEGPLKPEQLEAVVCRIKRNGRIIRCDNPVLKLWVSSWLFLKPFRYKILKSVRLIKRIAKKLMPFIRKKPRA